MAANTKAMHSTTIHIAATKRVIGMGSMWDIASAIIKWGNYLSMAIVIGGGFAFALMSHIEPKLKQATLRYIFVGCVLGTCTTILFFISQVGGINQQGLSGAFDLSMMQIIFQSDIGLQTGMRLASFILSFLFLWRLKKQPDRNSNSSILRALPLELYLPITIVFAISFAVIGHVSQLGVIARFAIVFHIICVFLWTGALYPLYLVCASKHGSKVAGIMKEFGKCGVYFVSAILLTGTFLLLQLLGSVSEFVTTSYGNAVLIKLVLVACLLVLAAMNKFQLSPGIENNNGELKLRNSIQLEIVFATLIVAITAYFTTLIGIAHG